MGREESERKNGQRQLYLFLVSFFQTLSFSPSPSLSTFCASTSFSPLLTFSSAPSLCLSLTPCFPPCLSTSKSLFISFTVSISKSLSNSVLSSVFLFSLSIYLPLSPLLLHSLSLVSFYTISLPLCLSSLYSSLLSTAAFVSQLKQRDRQDKTNWKIERQEI